MAKNEILIYKGPLNHEMINGLIHKVQNRFIELDVLYNLQKRGITILIELLENSCNYMRKLNNEEIADLPDPEMHIVQSDDVLHFYSGNLIFKEDSKILERKLKELNNIEISKIRDYYKFAMVGSMHSQKGTGGIGLMRILKIAKSRFNYSFKKIDDKFLYYNVEIILKN